MNVVQPKNLGDLLREKLGLPVRVEIQHRKLEPRDNRARLDRFCDALQFKGWRHLDTRQGGCMCEAIYESRDGSKILKISNNYSKRQEGDYYSEFAKWVCTQNSPHLPKIYKAMSICKGEFFLVVMERLEHLPYNDEGDIINKYWYVQPLIAGYHTNVYGLVACGMGSIAKTIVDMFNALGKWTDCHTGNIMLRGDTIVFTDPYSSAPWRDGEKKILLPHIKD